MTKLRLMKGAAGLKWSLMLWLIATPIYYWAIRWFMSQPLNIENTLILLTVYAPGLWLLSLTAQSIYKGLTKQFHLQTTEGKKIQDHRLWRNGF